MVLSCEDFDMRNSILIRSLIIELSGEKVILYAFDYNTPARCLLKKVEISQATV